MIPPLPGKEARFVWHGPNGDLVLNDLSSGYPRYFIHTIGGWRSTADVDLASEQSTGGEGERSRVSFRRGKTITFEGRTEAQTIEDLRTAEDLLLAGFWDTTLERDCSVEVLATQSETVPSTTIRHNLLKNPNWGYSVDNTVNGWQTNAIFWNPGFPNALPLTRSVAGDTDFDGRGWESSIDPASPVYTGSGGTGKQWGVLEPTDPTTDPDSAVVPVSAGQAFALRIRLKVISKVIAQVGTGIGPFNLWVEYVNLTGPSGWGGTLVSSSPSSAFTTPAGTLLDFASIIQVPLDLPAGYGMRVSIRIPIPGDINIGGRFRVGKVMISEVESTVSSLVDYFDGDSTQVPPDGVFVEWSGLPYKSVSNLRAAQEVPSDVKAWTPVYTFKARPLSVDGPENQPYGQNRHTYGWERTFIATLRMHSPKFYHVDEVYVTSGDIAGSNFGLTPPFVVPADLPESLPFGLVQFENEGLASADPLLRLYGPITDPEIINDSIPASFALTGLTIPVGQWIDIDFHNRSVLLNSNADQRRFLKGNWWDRGVPGLVPGTNIIRVGGQGIVSPAHLDIFFHPTRY
jgi:hypothetical protein